MDVESPQFGYLGSWGNSLLQLHRRIWYFANLLAGCFKDVPSCNGIGCVSFHPSNERITVLNIDGSSLGNPDPSWFGGLLCNNDGAWIKCFYSYIGITNDLHAKLVTLYLGLSLAWDNGTRHLQCYSDSIKAIFLVSLPLEPWHQYAAIVQSIKDVIARNWIIRIFAQGGQCLCRLLGETWYFLWLGLGCSRSCSFGSFECSIGWC